MDEQIHYYLIQFQQQCSNIQLFTANLAEADFVVNPLIKNAVAMSFIVLGEIANRLNQINAELIQSNHHIPWRIMIDMRNRMAHDFYGLDWRIVYRTAIIEIPKLAQEIELIIENKYRSGSLK